MGTTSQNNRCCNCCYWNSYTGECSVTGEKKQSQNSCCDFDED